MTEEATRLLSETFPEGVFLTPDLIKLAEHVAEQRTLLAIQLKEIRTRIDALYKPSQAE